MGAPDLSLGEDEPKQLNDAKQSKDDGCIYVSDQSRVGSLLLAEKRMLEMIAEAPA